MNASFDPHVVLRPRTFDETIDLSLAYVRTHAKDFLRLSVACIAVATLVLVALKTAFDLHWGIVWAIALALTALIERVVVAYAGAHLFGNRPKVAKAASRLLERPVVLIHGAPLASLPLFPMLLTDFDDVWVGISLATALLFSPFFLAFALYVQHVLVLESLPLTRGVKRALSLVSYRFPRALAFVALFSAPLRVCFVLVAEQVAIFGFSFILQLGTPFDTLFVHRGSWASVIGLLISAPVISSARLFDYIDARTVLEGWDIQVRFKGIKSRDASEKRMAA